MPERTGARPPWKILLRELDLNDQRGYQESDRQV